MTFMGDDASPSATPPTAERPTPAQHAAQSFAPEELSAPPPKVVGPFVDTSSSHTIQAAAGSEVAGVQVVLGEEERDEAMKWNQERIEKRMRGEYERAGKQLSELVSDNIETPLRLNAIRISGANSTRSSFLASVIAPYLSPLPAASYMSSRPVDTPSQTLGSLLKTTRDVTATLRAFDIFKDIDAGLEASPSVLAEAEDVDIVLRVKEAPKYFLRTATDIGDGEGSATGTARVRNAFGGAEIIEGNVSFGTRTKNAFQLRLDAPVNASPTTRMEISLFSAQRDLKHYASCSEGVRGGHARLKYLSRFGFHEIAYEAALRQLEDVAPSASMSIRDSAGQTVKSSISHAITRDTRNDPFLPTSGSYLRLRQEFAGLGGDAHFVKSESETSMTRLIKKGWTISLGLRTGCLFPLGRQPSLFLDRFHLGGPTSVRMFRPNAMGPKDSGDYTGGDLHWAAGLSLVGPFPRRPDWPLKTHMFLNAGRLTRFEQDKPLIQSIGCLITQPSVTAGLGLMYRHSLVRIEMNVGVPLAMNARDGAVKGLQFGLGLSFL